MILTELWLISSEPYFFDQRRNINDLLLLANSTYKPGEPFCSGKFSFIPGMSIAQFPSIQHNVY